MKIFYTEEFKKVFRLLPFNVKKIFKKQEEIFLVCWKDPRLHIKGLKGNRNDFSFRVTRKYRVLFKLADENSSLFLSIGHRKDIYG